FDTERLPTADLYIAPETYRRRFDLMHERFESMLRYVGSDDECRSAVLERYFGAADARECGVCDVCLARRKDRRTGADMETKIINALKNSSMSVRELIAAVGGNETTAVAAVDKLIDEGKISSSVDGKLAIIE
ncbi:MAG: RecQ family zinc-binding domain-containing protein, partial [Alistipes sp.]|nr:RecQ family zinc-binding domain-containing protein [Alistipes sp.]